MTMQSQYKSKIPNTAKKFKKKENNSTTTFKKIMGIQNNYLTVAPGECPKTTNFNKTKSSRARLKTVDSKSKLISGKENKIYQDGNHNYGGMNDANDRPSSGKKKKSNKKQKPKVHHDFTQRTYTHNSKELQNKIRFHPLSKDTPTGLTRNSLNF